MSWNGFFKSRLTTWGMSIVLLLVMVFAAKILIQKYQVDKETAKLENQVQKIKQDNQQLSSLIQYYGSQDYEEKAAREKLSLQKNGEYVVGLPQQDETNPSTQTKTGSGSNYKKWFNYFFSQTSGR
ncbi:MAG: septum formation initiator family protein [Candidatus Doudnabacteria bacterium]